MGAAWEDRIVVDRDISGSKAVVKGARLAVELIIGLLAEGWSESELLRSYPGLAREDIRACLSHARVCLSAGSDVSGIQAVPAEEKKLTLGDFFTLLHSLDWPDHEFARDLEAIQASQPRAEFPDWLS